MSSSKSLAVSRSTSAPAGTGRPLKSSVPATSVLPASVPATAKRKVGYRGCRSGDVGAYVRKCSGGCWQARLWIGQDNGGHVHLGLYESAEAARQVARKVLKSLPLGVPWDALEVWRTAKKLARNGFDVEDQLSRLLPKYVVRVSDGGSRGGGGEFGYRLRGGVSRPVDAGGYTTAEDAYRAAVEEVAKLPPPLTSWAREQRRRRAERRAKYARAGIEWREQLTIAMEVSEG